MENQSDSYRSRWLMLLGGLALGTFLTGGLAYFETFGQVVDISYYLPMMGLLGALGVPLSVLLFRKRRLNEKLAWGILRLVVLLPAYIGLGGILLLLYHSYASGETAGSELSERVFSHLALLGVLPLTAALVFLQGRPPTYEIVTAKLALDQSHESKANKESLFSLDSGSGDQVFQIPFESLILVEAADNYCKFYYLEKEALQTEMLRTKMKDVEEALEGVSGFFRCHRSYLVNGKMVTAITGPSQNQRLELAHGLEPVRVSRSFDPEPLQTFMAGKRQS